MASLHNDEFYERWPGATLKDSILNEPSLLDDELAITWMDGVLGEPQFSEGFMRQWHIGTVNVDTGDF